MIASMKSRLLYLPGIDEHVPLRGGNSEFYEVSERVTAAFERLKESGLLDYIDVVDSSDGNTDVYCSVEQMSSCHEQQYIDFMENTVVLESDEQLTHAAEHFECISICQSSFNYAKRVAANLVNLCEDMMEGTAKNSFALVRPPSHHSEREMGANGYCLLNTTAIATKHVISKNKKVLIFDWDVHHGQGTQGLFYDTDQVLYISMHSFQNAHFYPYLQESDIFHTGEGQGMGYNVNIAWNQSGLGDAEYMAAFLQIVLPLAYAFDPDLVLVLSGFDSAEGDCEGDMKVSPACFAHMTHHLKALANGRLLMVLEGGYNPSVVASCVEAVVSVLAGMPPPFLELKQEPNSEAVQTILDVIGVLSDFWNCFQFQEENSEEPKRYNIPCEKKEFLIDFESSAEKPNNVKGVTIAGLEQLENRRIGYCFDPKMLMHKNEQDSSHPERPERIATINSHLATLGLLSEEKCVLTGSQSAEDSLLKLIHAEDYIEALRSLDCEDEIQFESFAKAYSLGSTFHNKRTYECADVSCGALLKLTSKVMETGAGQIKDLNINSGFANIRPPGHHAEVGKEYGFCFFNNVAVAAQYALNNFGESVNRILILDWDVHHGNGTQHQFENNPNVLYVSLHRHGFFFPGGPDGNSDRVGCGPGEGFNINIPWMVGGAKDVDYIAAFTNVVLPVLYQFCPDLVFVSSGFDSAVGDPLGGQYVSPTCYAHMTHMLMAFAHGRVIIALEGGYNLQTISRCAEKCVRTLLHEACPRFKHISFKDTPVQPVHRQGILETIWHHSKYWKQLRFMKSVEQIRTERVLDPEFNPEELPGRPDWDTRESMLYWRDFWKKKCQAGSDS